MPGFDGTGPEGSGPRTGRGRGKCSGSGSGLLEKSFMYIIVPTIGAVVNDVRNPDGITRRLYSSLKLRLSSRPSEDPSERFISEKKNGERSE